MYANPLHPYPAYKPSGVPWLGDVPQHWAMRRLKYILQERDDRSTDGSQQLLRVSQYSGVSKRKQVEDGEGPDTRAESLVGYKVVECDDLVVNIMLAWNGSLGVSQVGGIASPAYCVYWFFGHANPRFFHHLLRSQGYKAYIRTASTGVVDSRLRLYTDSLYLLYAPLPPLPEQRTIVRYLDYVDRRIRRYVTAKRKLIALLEEEKQAVINQAVTRGLDPNVRLKPSSVEWLGDVPEHWEVWPLGYLATKFGSGITPRGGAAVYQESGVPLLRSQNIHFDGLRMQNVARIPPSLHEELSGSHVKPGDVLLNITGASIGRVCSIPNDFKEGNVNQHVCIIRPKRSHLSPELLAAYLSTPVIQREIQFEQSGASREGLTLQSIRNFRVLVPPLTEQQAIVEYIDRATAAIKTAMAHARQQIELVEEYRTRLIADVVTGKLDVRDAAVQLPDEADDQDPIEESYPLADDLPGNLYAIDEPVEDLVLEQEVTA